jgi:signal transduction histidine kinase
LATTATEFSSVQHEIEYMHRGLALAALLAASARRSTRRSAVIVVTLIVSTVLPAHLTLAALTTAMTIVVLLNDLRGPAADRRFTIAALIGTLLWSTSAFVVVPFDVTPRPALRLYCVGFAVTALAVVTHAYLTARTRRPTVSDVVRDGGLRGLRVGVLTPNGTWEGLDGTPFEPAERHGVELDLGDAGRVLVESSDDLIRGATTERLVAGLRLLLGHRAAIATTLQRARAVADSEQRLRDAEDLAVIELESELDRLVLGRLDAAVDALQASGAPAAEHARQALYTVRSEIVSLSAGLLPSPLHGGVAQALTALTVGHSFPVHLDLTDVVAPDIPPAIGRALYFAAAECITNVERHSGAAGAWLRLRRTTAAWELTVSDDGRGGAHPVDTGGLAGLRSRVARLDGELEIETRPDGGTLITVRLPHTDDTSIDLHEADLDHRADVPDHLTVDRVG